MTAAVIAYRRFHNTDPPKLLQLWHESQLGRGAAQHFATDSLEYFVFAQPHFDRDGLIVACDADRVVGFVHATRAVNADESGLQESSGAVVALLVHPDYRRRGIGKELLGRGTAYLEQMGVQLVQLGADEFTNGFWLGLYGGAQPSGFLRSDEGFPGFCAAVGWHAAAEWRVYQRALDGSQRDPVNVRLVGNRRRTRLDAGDVVDGATWWWATRFGRLDTLQFKLLDKATSSVVATADIYGLDAYMPSWGTRAVGLNRIRVPLDLRRRGYAQTLLVEVSRYLRDQLITLVEAHVRDDDEAAIGLLEAAGFEQRDTGTVYVPAGSSV